MSLEKQLIDLGKAHRKLRPHIRPVLASLKTSGSLGNKSLAQMKSLWLEELGEEIVQGIRRFLKQKSIFWSVRLNMIGMGSNTALIVLDGDEGELNGYDITVDQDSVVLIKRGSVVGKTSINTTLSGAARVFTQEITQFIDDTASPATRM